MPLTAYEDHSGPELTTPESGGYPREPDPVPGDPDYMPDQEGAWQAPRLLPGRFFEDRYREPRKTEAHARQSAAVEGRIAGSCCGWRRPHPTSSDFYDAVRAEEPTPEQKMLIEMWMDEALEEEILDAWRDNVYTWRQLAEACRRTGRRRCRLYRVLNTHSLWVGDEDLEELWTETAPGPLAGKRGPW